MSHPAIYQTGLKFIHMQLLLRSMYMRGHNKLPPDLDVWINESWIAIYHIIHFTIFRIVESFWHITVSLTSSTLAKRYQVFIWKIIPGQEAKWSFHDHLHAMMYSFFGSPVSTVQYKDRIPSINLILLLTRMLHIPRSAPRKMEALEAWKTDFTEMHCSWIKCPFEAQSF